MTPSQLVAFCSKHGVTLSQLRDTKTHYAARQVREQLFAKLVAEGMNGGEIARLVGVGTNTAYSAVRRLQSRAQKAEAKSKLDARIADILPAEQRVHLRLVADPHPDRLYRRRRDECARHWTCVDEWIEVHGSDPAACPTKTDGTLKCLHYEPIDEAEAAE